MEYKLCKETIKVYIFLYRVSLCRMASTEYKLWKETKKVYRLLYSVQNCDKPLPVSIYCALYKRPSPQLTEIIPCVWQCVLLIYLLGA